MPLNTALLAVQNMEASGTVAKAQEIEFKALEGSLSMMSKVLNDVLDFNRMDSGRFESVLKPYAFHKVMRSLFVPLQLATDARSLRFLTELDKSIDDVARRALYEAMGLGDEEIAKRMTLDEDGIVVGDETRLRQIITNLARYVLVRLPLSGVQGSTRDSQQRLQVHLGRWQALSNDSLNTTEPLPALIHTGIYFQCPRSAQERVSTIIPNTSWAKYRYALLRSKLPHSF